METQALWTYYERRQTEREQIVDVDIVYLDRDGDEHRLVVD